MKEALYLKKNSAFLKARSIPYLVLLFLAIGLITACDKNDPLPEEEEIPSNEHLFNRLILVKNFGVQLPEGDEPTDAQSPLYYSLEQNQAIDPEHQRSSRWDLSFSEIYRSFINCNNAAGGYGKDGSGKGGILLVKQKFEDVIDIPADNLFREGEKAYGTDDSGDFGEGLGWYLYDFNATIMGGGAEDKKHVCYPIEGHTLIVRTAKGNYAKVKIISIYKDLLDPKDWYRDSPMPYFTFQYVLAKAGSTSFEIKE